MESFDVIFGLAGTKLGCAATTSEVLALTRMAFPDSDLAEFDIVLNGGATVAAVSAATLQMQENVRIVADVNVVRRREDALEPFLKALNCHEDDAFEHLGALAQINIVNKKLTALPYSAFRDHRECFQNVRYLLCDDNLLRYLPASMSIMTEVTTASFDMNRFSTVPPELRTFQLVVLNLQRNLITDVSEWVGDIPTLKILNLGCNRIRHFPVGGFPSLEWINLEQNRIRHAGNNNQCCYPKLNTINLSSNPLVELPRECVASVVIGKRCSHISLVPLPAAVDIIFSSSSLRNIDCVVESHSLRSLKLDNNELVQLPEDLKTLKHLEELDVSSNWLRTLPSKIGHDLVSLRSLKMSFNSLTVLPQSICALKHLEVLLVDQNQLTSLPSKLGDLKALKILSVEQNNLRHLPRTLCRLSSLEVLRVRFNHFAQLPSGFGRLRKSLVYLEHI